MFLPDTSQTVKHHKRFCSGARSFQWRLPSSWKKMLIILTIKRERIFARAFPANERRWCQSFENKETK